MFVTVEQASPDQFQRDAEVQGLHEHFVFAPKSCLIPLRLSSSNQSAETQKMLLRFHLGGVSQHVS
jgi:hypothetical protein